MAASHAALKRDLDAECAALRSLLALLREEQQALVYGKVERLESWAVPKAQLLGELARYAEQRHKLLQAAGRTAHAASVEAWLREHEDGGELAQRWQAVLDMTRIAQQLNVTNGLLIDTRLHNTQQALDALFSAARIPRTYAPDGSTVSLHAQHTRAVA